MCIVTKHTFKSCGCGRIQRCHSARALPILWTDQVPRKSGREYLCSR